MTPLVLSAFTAVNALGCGVEVAGEAVRITGFPAIKFLAPLKPGQEFEGVLTVKRPGQSNFDILASGTVDCALSAEAAR